MNAADVQVPTAAGKFYEHVPPLGEAEMIHAAVPPDAEILELCCGAGRITRGLVALGHRVVAVDRSRQMLAKIDGAETHAADVAQLDLGRRFDVVVLPGNFVNVPQPEKRVDFLTACATHASPRGCVIFERIPPSWNPFEGQVSRWGGATITIRDIERNGPFVCATLVLRIAGEAWLQPLVVRRLSDPELDAALAEVGLRRRRVLDARGAWVVATRDFEVVREDAQEEQ